MRTSGILMPVFSLPGGYGIGCFSKEAYQFVDFLKRAGQTYWQILPLGPTSYGDSPYQSFSTFAGNPYFIDLDVLVEKGLLNSSELSVTISNQTGIAYDRLYIERFKLLKLAFSRIKKKEKSYDVFVKNNADWIFDYALFMALKDAHDGCSFTGWEDCYRLRDKKALKAFSKKHKNDIAFYQWVQYEFDQQWKKLKKYANDKGIKIIGDIPIYVSGDSSDVWSSPELFLLDKKLRPIAVAGHPPDCFSETGQLWGNPLYRWPYHKKTGYKWWIKRFKKSLELYDVIRIDHFRGFDEYYSIPAADKTAENGEWLPGPRAEMFKKIEKKLGNMAIIAEDLGLVTDGVRKLVKDTGYPNMKIIQNAFDDLSKRDERGMTNEHLPYNYDHNCVVYTGTHDNDTLIGFLEHAEDPIKENIRLFLHLNEDASDKEIAEGMIHLAFASPADYCIIPMADHLYLDGDYRINLPGTLGGNWMWRAGKEQLTDELADEIAKLTDIYGRR